MSSTKLLVFYDKTCIACIMFASLMKEAGYRWNYDIVEVYEASRNPDMFEKYQIETIPRALEIDEHGNVIEVYRGLASFDKLTKFMVRDE